MPSRKSRSRSSSRSKSSSRSSRGGAATATAAIKPTPVATPTTMPIKPTTTVPVKPVAPTPLSTAVAADVKKGGKRSRRGGDGAADWTLKNFGTGNQQWQNTFSNGDSQQGNLIATLPGAPAVLPNNLPQSSIAANAASVMKGGKKRTKRGGYWAHVLNQALVPFGLVGLQHKYSKHVRSHNKTKKYGK